MAGFLDRAKETAQRGLDAGKQKVEEVQAARAGHELLRKLGAAYYAEKRGSGSPEEVDKALTAVEAHIARHGDAFLRGGSPLL
ncbi:MULTISPECIES: hypothetical protein [Streptomycetaceae]|uniref:Uncharacterized protein n=1 Tax=Streptantibioticus cattleyicolor (strain ATCC 35852 / DSM 46488 / JCM 4925 / NBRC 14057 / NRRL 8057) TaxID=1003195 RepID=F8K3A8_STREN|nr:MULTISPECIES: hypothetical protein [Streptomycetaceae]AEW95019.1 hypothetical protein SCATT_26480 [Streptantibioticus cattleyicolor NRRL 8057 = DSM 46488]MYS59620.1 hypothetical protein [Streptomyces sp. SID5468]CCB75372.1 protein of unknown function [Streptantibioticus cattleyicolor NRRL 8057 = DSM 46488]